MYLDNSMSTTLLNPITGCIAIILVLLATGTAQSGERRDMHVQVKEVLCAQCPQNGDLFEICNYCDKVSMAQVLDGVKGVLSYKVDNYVFTADIAFDPAVTSEQKIRTFLDRRGYVLAPSTGEGEANPASGKPTD